MAKCSSTRNRRREGNGSERPPLPFGYDDHHNKNTRSKVAFTVPNTPFDPSGRPKHDLRGRCRLEGSRQRGSPARYRQLVKAAIVYAGL